MQATLETYEMAKSRGRPKKAESEVGDRVTIISLKGNEEQAAWMESIHRETYIPKAVILRLALAAWAEQKGYPPFPMGGDN